jgi:hypothetical protein
MWFWENGLRQVDKGEVSRLYPPLYAGSEKVKEEVRECVVLVTKESKRETDVVVGSAAQFHRSSS